QAPPFLLDHGIISNAVVLVPGSEGPVGAIGASTTRQRNFSRDEVNFLQGAANVLGAALERRRAEQVIQQSQAMFQGLFEFSPDAIVVIDAQGSIVRFNAQIERLFGYDRGELVS